MKIKKIDVILAALFLLFSISACSTQKTSETTQEETLGAAPVKLFKARRQRISEKLNFTGLIDPLKKINITPDISGKIERIYVEEGDRVSQGQLLAELDTRTIKLQLNQAEAAVAVAEANYKDAQRNIDRMERLRQENAVSEQQYEKIKLAHEAAEAQLKQAQAALNLAKHSLNVALMRAPFNGVIASRNAEEGDVINPMMGGYSSASGVLTLMDFSKVKVEIGVSTNNISRIKKGQKTILKVSAYPEKEFVGQVILVNLTADPQSKKFKVEIQAENPDLLLRPNTFGEVILEVSTNEDALVIPQKAIIENQYVFIAEGETAVKREIVIGLQNTEMVEIIQGLTEGEMVIIEGNYGLQDGAKLEVTEVVQ